MQIFYFDGCYAIVTILIVKQRKIYSRSFQFFPHAASEICEKPKFVLRKKSLILLSKYFVVCAISTADCLNC